MKTVFFDVDTQLDFLFPGGALYVPGAEKIAPTLSALTSFAAQHGVRVLSTLDSHTENDPEFSVWPPHCVLGTHGHQKYSATLLPSPSQQTLFHKNTIEFFSTPGLRELLDALKADRFIVYGLVTEYCVQAALFGLLARQVEVGLVTDAIRCLHPEEERAVLARFTGAGGRLLTWADLNSDQSFR